MRQSGAVLLPVERLKRICNPFSPLWDTPDTGKWRITRRQVRSFVASGQVEATPFDPRKDCETWTLARHAMRVAYLVRTGWGDPIMIDVGVPGLSGQSEWPLVDGNHRLAAALICDDEHIAASVSGSCSLARRLFGVNI